MPRYNRVGSKPASNGDRGAAGEHFVIAHLLSRLLLVGRPCNPVSKHDVFVKAAGKWRTIQVKVGRVDSVTNHLSLRKGRKDIVSDLIAVVDLDGKRIRWISNTTEDVPEELL